MPWVSIMPVMRRMVRHWVLKAATIGDLRASLMASMVGSGGRRRRTIITPRPMTRPNRKAARQPQEAIAVAESRPVIAAPTIDPSSIPAEAPVGAKLPTMPRRLRWADSTRSTIEVVNSPPTARPWDRRSTIKRIGAKMPIWA